MIKRLLGLLLLILHNPSPAQQIADTTFNPPIAQPAYPTARGPVVLLDEAHFNFHTTTGRYRPFAQLLRRDGYVVQASTSRFDKKSLQQGKILVIANALAEINSEGSWALPNPSAFADDEIAVLRDLGARWRRPVIDRRSHASLITFTGSAFQVDGSVQSLLVLDSSQRLLLPETAWQFTAKTPRLSAVGWLQGATLKFGKGRIAAFGEAAMFSAQLSGPNRQPMGMNSPQATQNYRFLLNVMHWLSGLPEQ